MRFPFRPGRLCCVVLTCEAQEEEEEDRKRPRRDDLARFFDLEAEAGSEDEDEDQEVEEGFEEALAEVMRALMWL